MKLPKKFVASLLVLVTFLQIDVASAASPSTGTIVNWTNDTYFDAYSSQSGVTNSDLPQTNDLVWQLYYANAPLTIPADGINRLGLNTYLSGTNAWKFKVAISTVDDTLGNFGADTEFGSKDMNSYSMGGFNQSTAATLVTIPARRYFIIGVHTGPYNRTFKTLSGNRSAQIDGLTYVTALNTIYYAPHSNTVISGVPTALGGSSNAFTTYNGYVAMYSIKFKATGMPTGMALTTPDIPTATSVGSASAIFSETALVANAQSYTASLYASNGTTLLETRTVTNSQVTDGYAWSGLSPNETYKIGFTAVGDGATYSNSLMSSLRTFTTTKSTTSVTITFSASEGSFNTPFTITATTTESGVGKATFFANEKRISRCTSKSINSFTGTCVWKPPNRGAISIKVQFTPSSAAYLGSVNTKNVFVQSRKTNR